MIGGGDHEPGQQHLGVAVAERVDEEQAHAVDGEDLLGDDQAAEQRSDVDRHNVTRGIRALRSACLRITLRRDRPLAVAVRM